MNPKQNLDVVEAERSLARWLFAVLVDWTIIGISIAAAYASRNWFAYILAVLIVGNRQHALSVLGHDGAHYAITKNRWLNDALACLLCWWPLGVGIHGYRRFHFQHHQHTGTPLDTELHIKAKETPDWDLPITRKRMLWYFVKDLCGLSAKAVIYLIESTRPAKMIDWIGPVVLGSLIAFCLYKVQALWVLAFWFAAMPTSFWAFFRVRVYHEHHGTAGTYRVHLPFWYRQLFAPHKIWVHYEHHRWPHLPYFQLLKLRALDTSVPVTSVFDLLKSYAHYHPPLKAGTPVSQTPWTGEGLRNLSHAPLYSETGTDRRN